jgi:hypothetical protein
VKKNSFGLLELEMADLECVWRKTPLGPLGVNAGPMTVESGFPSTFKFCNLIFRIPPKGCRSFFSKKCSNLPFLAQEVQIEEKN